MASMRKWLFAAALALGAGLASAAGAAGTAEVPRDGVEYQTLATPQNTPAGKQVEIIEFFDYACPHCFAFEPVLAAWLKAQGDSVVFRRVHVPRDANVEPRQRLFFTLEAMGLVDKYHNKVFDAIHVERQHMNRDEMIFDWAEKAGIDRTKFIDTYRSFGVQAKVRQANAMMESYLISMWPTIIVDGRFQTSPTHAIRGKTAPQSEAQRQQAALAVMDYLLARARAEKK